MFYRPIWIAILFLYRVFFKRYYTSGYENIVKDKPIIFVGNHVNAFLDPLMMPSQFWKKIYYIVRGDIFNTPFKRWALWQTHQMPIYRARDGKENLQKNEATNEKSYDLLSKNNWILIFSEGDCVQEKHLRSIKKGTARMAFGAIEKYGWDMDLHIIPSTENYTHPSKFRSEVMVNVGKPIRLLDYKKLYEEDQAKAMNMLIKDIQEAMLKAYIHVENRADLPLFEELIEIERNNNPEKLLPWKTRNSKRFDREQSVANHINELRENQESKLENLKTLTKDYYSKLNDLRLKDSYFGNFKPNLLVGIIFGILIMPIFITGNLLFITQYKIADSIAVNKIKLIHFKNSIRLGVLLAINLVLILIFIILFSFYNVYLAAAIPLLASVLAWTTLTYKEQMQKQLEYIRYKKIDKKNENKVAELKNLRGQIVDSIW